MRLAKFYLYDITGSSYRQAVQVAQVLDASGKQSSAICDQGGQKIAKLLFDYALLINNTYLKLKLVLGSTQLLVCVVKRTLHTFSETWSVCAYWVLCVHASGPNISIDVNSPFANGNDISKKHMKRKIKMPTFPKRKAQSSIVRSNATADIHRTMPT